MSMYSERNGGTSVEVHSVRKTCEKIESPELCLNLDNSSSSASSGYGNSASCSSDNTFQEETDLKNEFHCEELVHKKPIDLSIEKVEACIRQILGDEKSSTVRSQLAVDETLSEQGSSEALAVLSTAIETIENDEVASDEEEEPSTLSESLQYLDYDTSNETCSERGGNWSSQSNLSDISEPDETGVTTSTPVQKIEHIQDEEKIEHIRDVKKIEHIQDVKKIEHIQDVKKIEHIQDVKKTEHIQDLKKIEHIQDVKKTEHIQDVKKIEHIQNVKRIEHIQDVPSQKRDIPSTQQRHDPEQVPQLQQEIPVNPDWYGLAAPLNGTHVPNRIFVGGISSHTTEDELTDFFSAYGNVINSKIIYDSAGVSKNYGFITFGTDREASSLCMAVRNKKLKPVIIRDHVVNIAPAVKKDSPRCDIKLQYVQPSPSPYLGATYYMTQGSNPQYLYQAPPVQDHVFSPDHPYGSVSTAHYAGRPITNATCMYCPPDPYAAYPRNPIPCYVPCYPHLLSQYNSGNSTCCPAPPIQVEPYPSAWQSATPCYPGYEATTDASLGYNSTSA